MRSIVVCVAILMLTAPAFAHYFEISKPACGSILQLDKNFTVEWQTEGVEEPTVTFILRRGPAPDRGARIITTPLDEEYVLAEGVSATSNQVILPTALRRFSTSVYLPSSIKVGYYHLVTIFVTDGGLPGHLRTSRDFLVVSAAQGRYIASGALTISRPRPRSVQTFGAPLLVSWALLNITGNVNIRIKDQPFDGVPNTGRVTLPGTYTSALAAFKNNGRDGLIETSANFFVVLEDTYNANILGVSKCFEFEPSYLSVTAPPTASLATGALISWETPQIAWVSSFEISLTSLAGRTTRPLSLPKSYTMWRVTEGLTNGYWYATVKAKLATSQNVQGSVRNETYGVSNVFYASGH
mmetsp:Transcript_36648/g.59239  ORF Transcript_36648/g.59239 Transcript_36648/m.59239 type:complete len:354 (+) Transcript_36648:138-1199(+)|eukprot:CAMPEP_0184650584 /NCGR_PEP_ID=MMETSP0308-20130426/8137_1 /TAXON_ID=38269 /ORGANISM="Gloeochaete witrockiana, Strain SAG 46.84" /LENGTH=353 /DNA_ID=CAMNT_0027084229 /DNA_START=59 /DNA_END=1120 /DNA_ORIENTATION=-